MRVYNLNMSNIDVNVYDTYALAEAAIESLDSSIEAHIEELLIGGASKYMVIRDTNTASSITQLTEPGASSWISTGKSINHTIVVTIAAINTNVVLRIEGTIDGTNAFNLSDSDTDTTITANGSYAFMASGILTGIRVNFVSESGGTDSTVDAKYLGA